MAVAVDFRHFTPVNSRDDLKRRIEEAPEEHAEAILEAYELLQQLHEKGILAILTGLLTAGNHVVEHVVSLISSKEAIVATRVGLMLVNLLSTLDADALHAAIAGGADPNPPSMLTVGKQAMSADARRGMATGVALLNVFGAALAKQKVGH